MGRTCGTNGGEMYVEFWWESMKKKSHVQEGGVGGNIILE